MMFRSQFDNISIEQGNSIRLPVGLVAFLAMGFWPGL